ncbi:isopentenyl-diphosphate delta-isomerase [Pedobacter psychrotolerans]|uniref:Isopentenyl-diphosphate delta-isomerase n=1 Tax=Pedobacter psychrotolerans TaxID=1843235 RepID=A0A4V2RYY2_9SPHI|nr:isopentenyl-diphosphate Delta-isomerase [Pedobacter psychrotolerans]TCO22462.1 isopentenyl-diphosphate delta-isomerase [Pedobacter psychrotolerans]GGE64744.1 isopentenyl-diphosphate Delta-isomerase [Pedobacter psychrotolerans]
MEDQVILVDVNDFPVGYMEKLEAHQKGILHRAFSIFIFNSKDELLLQQRAINKYHSGGLWTNTCCSHPKPGENNLEAANRRLMEEMGMKTDLSYAFNFTYRAAFDNGLIEHEFDHVFFGKSDLLPILNREEVENFKYLSLPSLKEELQRNPDDYTPWLRICLDKVIEHYQSY